ncbi:WhiB family transcriptional regulator [Modestobacter italicus]|uniref:WhiB family transcriptional regulator n=1 Tax=Modestobacter italicus (strain DSM 44449 / CECT 9708 / BC 501) TaxID=2732864 RepID=UPI0014133930
MTRPRRHTDESARQRTSVLLWQDRALCAQIDPEVFFPARGESTRTAKDVCAACPVMGRCLDQALADDERYGVWGGLSERERRALQRHLSSGG